MGLPVAKDGAGPADHDVEQSGVDPSLVIAGQADNPGDRPRPVWSAVSPEMLVHTDRLHAPVPVGIGGPLLGDRFGCFPTSVPVDVERPGKSCDMGIVVFNPVDQPRPGPRRELGSGGDR